MQQHLIVSGLGIITSLGNGIEANFSKLQKMQHGLSSLELIDTIHAKQFPFGEIKTETANFLSALQLQTKKGFTRTSLLGINALMEAYNMAKIPMQNNLRIGLVNATTVGGMCEVEKYYFDILEKPGDYSEFSDTIDCADCSHRIADYFGIKHFVTTISTACSSSANAIILGARMVQQGIIDIAVCGGTDAMTRFTINGFNSLKNIDKNHCRPFDADRNGLNLGEGAAYVIIEKESTAKHRNAAPIVQLSGYSNYNEAFHPTAPNPEGEGAFQVMQRAIEKANVKPNEINYINAHGTATLTNDESESNAMKRLFEKVPPFSSTKCYTGHTLAAAGAIEACFSIASIKNQCLFGNLNFKTPIPDSKLIPQTYYEQDKEINHVMSNSFAFGGNNASLIFSKLNSN
jgi:3-oxoacyl-(acyl-carrier-protein) synthase